VTVDFTHAPPRCTRAVGLPTQVTLTAAGLEAWPLVAAVVHRYAAMLRGRHAHAGGLQWVFDEVASVAATQYR